jgi:hypothetical protein
VKTTFTYLACGTNPLSWLKDRPYTSIKTHCGFVSIEPAGPGRAKELEDVYGMRRGSVPGAHPVPKIEDLIATIRPDILIMQTGTNLFDLFPDRKTVNPHRHGPELRNYLVPFISKVTRSPSTLRKIYWVASPTSGRVSKEIQDFVVEQTRADIGHIANVIDSRTLVSYPYKHMEPDQVSAKLVFKTPPIPVKEFLPYQEFLVGYVYEVDHVIAGEYTEKQILVMHPAYIGLRRQWLRYRIGRTYKLRLHELEGTLWKTVKSKDDSGLINLQPYIRIEDEAKHPENAR